MSFTNNAGRSRWGNNHQSSARGSSRSPPLAASAADARNDDEAALAELLNEASARTEKQQGIERSSDTNSRRRQSGDKRVVEDDEKAYGSSKRRHRRWNDRDEGDSGPAPDRWGERSDRAIVDDDNDKSEATTENLSKIRANFGLSGALAMDTQTGNAREGITLKFSEPREARIPNTRWRLYVFRRKNIDEKPATDSSKKDDDLLDVYHISRQSAYLFGRERKVADIPVDHASLSKQHCVLQFRALPSKSSSLTGEPTKLQCKPYLMDLESTNGTFINGVRLDGARYYELRRGDVITLGASTREYVLLTEQSAKTGI